MGESHTLRIRLALWFFLLVTGLSAPSCRGCSDGSSGSAAGTPNTPPAAVVATPVGVHSSNIPISYSLLDGESDVVSILVEYSVDGGVTFTAATMGSGGDGTTGLTSSPGGTAHTFIWASRSDSVALSGPVATVQIRITPSDTAPGTPGSTGSFTVNNRITAYRITDLRLRDPHVFTNLSGMAPCTDVTDTGIVVPPLINVPSINQLIADRIAGDTQPADGYYDLSLLLLFRPLDQTAGTGARVDWAVGRCAVGSTSCDLDPAYTPIPVSYTNAATGTVLSPITGTTSPAVYAPPITLPGSPGFSTTEFAFTLNLGTTPLPLSGIRVGASYAGNPATTLQNGLILGFLAESDASVLMVSTPTGPVPLSALLPGGAGSCMTAYSDKDVGPDSVTPGWWFYYNFTAMEVTYTGP